MAPVVKQAPTAVQRPPMSAADKYKSYVRSSTNPSHQFDDNMKEPNNNNPGFKNPSNKSPRISNNNNSSSINNFNDDAPQFFSCVTSYSCTPAVITSVQSTQKIIESPKKIVQTEQGKQESGFSSSNNQLVKVESGKPGPNAQFNNVMNIQRLQQTQQIKQMEYSELPQQVNQTNQFNKLKNAEFGKPSPHAQLNNMKNAPTIPSPLVMVNDLPPQQPPRQRKTSNPVVGDRPQGPYGLAQSRSSPSIPSKGSSKSPNENLVLHYFQNPHTYKNLQERQLPGQGPVPKSMLPPPAPPVDKRKSTSPRNERRNSVPDAETGDDKNKDWAKVLTKFYNW